MALDSLAPADREGELKSPPALVSIVAAVTSTTLFQLTRGRRGKLRQLMWANRNAATGQLRIGETVAAAFTQRLPDIPIPPGIGGVETDFPEFVFTTDLIAQSTVGAAAPNDVQLMPTVEELEGDLT